MNIELRKLLWHATLSSGSKNEKAVDSSCCNSYGPERLHILWKRFGSLLGRWMKAWRC